MPELRTWMTGRDDPQELAPILSESRGRPVSTGWLGQKMGRPETPVVAALAEHRGSVVGIVAFGINDYWTRGGCLRVGLSYDTYVAPQWRGMGLFSTLLASAESSVAASGADMLLNFPNNNSRRGFEKAGWMPLDPMRPYVRPTREPFRVLPGRLRRVIQARGSYLEPVATGPLSDAAAQAFTTVGSAAEFGLEFALGPAQVSNRFHADRGNGYAFVQSGGASGIGRLGYRAEVKEFQFLAFSPRTPSIKLLRSLVASVEREHAPDVISFLVSSNDARANGYWRAGFVQLPANTIPYFRDLGRAPSISDYLLSGVDIHTW